MGKEAAVPLTNSISLADRFRIRHAIKQSKSKEYRDSCPFRHGKWEYDNLCKCCIRRYSINWNWVNFFPAQTLGTVILKNIIFEKKCSCYKIISGVFPNDLCVAVNS